MGSFNRRLFVPVMVLATLVASCGRVDSTASDGGRDVSPDTAVSAPTAATSSAPDAGQNHGTVTGHVTDSGGRPVSGALVVPQSLDTPANPVPELAVTTGANGSYRWILPPGSYRFTVALPSGAGTRAAEPETVSVLAGQATTANFVLRG